MGDQSGLADGSTSAALDLRHRSAVVSLHAVERLGLVVRLASPAPHPNPSPAGRGAQSGCPGTSAVGLPRRRCGQWVRHACIGRLKSPMADSVPPHDRERRPPGSRISGPLAAKLIQRSSRTDLAELQLHAEDRQHGEQLARAELRQFGQLEAGERLLRDADLRRHIALSEAEGASPFGDRLAKLLDGLHLMYSPKPEEFRSII